MPGIHWKDLVIRIGRAVQDSVGAGVAAISRAIVVATASAIARAWAISRKVWVIWFDFAVAPKIRVDVEALVDVEAR